MRPAMSRAVSSKAGGFNIYLLSWSRSCYGCAYLRPGGGGYQVLQVPIFSDNYSHVVVDESSGVTAAVDPADPAKVIAALDRDTRRLDALLITHKVCQESSASAYAECRSLNHIITFHNGRENGIKLRTGCFLEAARQHRV